MNFTFTVNVPEIGALCTGAFFLWRLTLMVAMAVKDIAPLKTSYAQLIEWQYRQDKAIARVEWHVELKPMADEKN